MQERKIALFTLLFFFVSGCSVVSESKSVKGSGNIITEKRAGIGDFKAVQLKFAGDCKITSQASSSVEVVGDDNIVPLVTTAVENGALVVSLDKSDKSGKAGQSGRLNIDPSQRLVVVIGTPHMQSVSLAGAGNVEVSGLNEADFAISVSGAGDSKIAGTAKNAKLSITGAGNANMNDLKSENVGVTITGAGDAQVDAEKSIDATITGAGSVRVKGHPKDVSKHITGAGSVSMVD